ncbi:MAG: helix-turn-helix transcriptional regulator [Nitrospinae bacterium]|nr:helix-turn-helix transcriptional regulator [Nitrospinota bacterium]MBL7021601.1 helix-turn-helix transcriptional regulator [Nitrospinaceae bacterium]
MAEKMNISLPTMNHYETGKRIPGSDFLARLAKVVDCNPGWLLSGEGDMQTNECYTSSHPPPEGFVLVPRYNIEASAGGGSVIHSEQVVDHLAFKTDWVHKELGTDPKNLLLIHSIGDSMEPTIRSGDLLLVDRNKSRMKGDGIYLINLDDGLMVKRIEWLLDGSVVIRGDNTVVSREQVVSSTDLEKLHILGRVVWVGSKI